MIRAQTIVARTPSALIASLDRFYVHSKVKGSTLLFTLSAPSDTLSAVTSHLNFLFPRHVGCLSSSLPVYGSHLTCAVALLKGITFRSTIAGLTDPQVGRIHVARRISEQKILAAQSEVFSEIDGNMDRVNWEDIWDRRPTAAQNLLPVELRMARPKDVSSILYFSDNAPQGICKALKATFPHSNELGFLASSTPFITGRPVTLFHDGEIYSDGAVGVALQPSSSLTAEFPGLVDLTPELKITSSEGNLILTIDGGNPTRLLLAAVNRRGLDHHDALLKDGEYYVGVMDNDKVERLHRITSGDPSRGIMALAAMTAPPQGSIVKMFYLPRRNEVALDLESAHQNGSVIFMATPDSIGDMVPPSILDSEVVIIDRIFVAGSENGFTLRRGAKEESWPCTLPGGRALLRWA